jgi:hypothetical protein
MMAESRVKGWGGLYPFQPRLEFLLAAAVMAVKELPQLVGSSFFERLEMRPLQEKISG